MLVVTSGIDGIFPKGFTIGTVTGVEKSGGAYRLITVEPAVDFSSLEEVLVVLTPTPAQETGPRRGADSEDGRRCAGHSAGACTADHPGAVHPGRRRSGSGARRRRLCGPVVRPGDRAADRDASRACCRTRCRAGSSGSADWRRTLSGFSPASSGRSSSWRSRCRASSCSSPRACCTRRCSSGVYELLGLRDFGAPYGSGGGSGRRQRAHRTGGLQGRGVAAGRGRSPAADDGIRLRR